MQGHPTPELQILPADIEHGATTPRLIHSIRGGSPVTMISRLCLFAALCLIATACSEDDPEETTSADLLGVYEVSRSAVVGSKRDTVSLNISNSSYSAIFITSAPKFCDADGEVSGWGTSKTTFTPRNSYGGNCDSVRTPRGEFVTEFHGHGDTVILIRTVPLTLPLEGDSLFVFRLLPSQLSQ